MSAADAQFDNDCRDDASSSKNDTTRSLSEIYDRRRHAAIFHLLFVQIGQGAAFSGMMPQLGGSFGVAIISTFISRQNMQHRSDLVTHLRIDHPGVQQRIADLQSTMMSKGMSSNTALSSAYKLLDNSVNLQSTVLSYMDVFL